MFDKNCDLCEGTGFYGDNGPGIRGNLEYVPCEKCNPKADGDYAVLGDGWRDVRKELPEIGEAVLTYNHYGISADERELFIGYINEEDKKWYVPWTDIELEPTHWRPLPDPPAFA